MAEDRLPERRPVHQYRGLTCRCGGPALGTYGALLFVEAALAGADGAACAPAVVNYNGGNIFLLDVKTAGFKHALADMQTPDFVTAYRISGEDKTGSLPGHCGVFLHARHEGVPIARGLAAAAGQGAAGAGTSGPGHLGGGIEIATRRPEVLRSVETHTLSGATATEGGDVFLEDAVAGNFRLPKQRVWARPLNIENEGSHLTNEGGDP